eukprot:TRINITY_DN58513_c0_g1_i1.p1 TRINITY_DN58513_c0_g1~~TRINITY_DN58513_c0_g1_i1.p1  ORF type:complete len:266 (-),score=52.39 TRINITY_DN58513_c0_g1_i1:324-1121(-)
MDLLAAAPEDGDGKVCEDTDRQSAEETTLQRLQRHVDNSLQSLTATFETLVERRLAAINDEVAERIEEVAAAYVDRAQSQLLQEVHQAKQAAAATLQSDALDLSTGSTSSRLPADVADIRGCILTLQEECKLLRQQHSSLEAIMTRIAMTTARDVTALRSSVAADLQRSASRVKEDMQAVKKSLQAAQQANHAVLASFRDELMRRRSAGVEIRSRGDREGVFLLFYDILSLISVLCASPQVVQWIGCPLRFYLSILEYLVRWPTA